MDAIKAVYPAFVDDLLLFTADWPGRFGFWFDYDSPDDYAELGGCFSNGDWIIQLDLISFWPHVMPSYDFLGFEYKKGLVQPDSGRYQIDWGLLFDRFLGLEKMAYYESWAPWKDDSLRDSVFVTVMILGGFYLPKLSGAFTTARFTDWLRDGHD